VGKLEHAQHGTIFLDEIESMPLALQVKLLRVLQERRLERLGSNDSIALDCRVIAASKADLLALSNKNQFREDLYFRLNGVTIDLPALNQRPGDIPLLLAFFMQGSAARFQKPVPSWSAQQMQQWQAMPWQGNVRELRNFADRWVLGVLPTESTPTSTGITGSSLNALAAKMDAYECLLITEALKLSDANVAEAADHLEIPKKTLYDKIKKYQLKPVRAQATAA
jgi:two-component system C4-dicarboxylate transport response regulator DctD